MTTLETTQSLPLRITNDGTVRVASTRVSLDSVVHHYRLGATAEEIVQKFPALDLADVYGAIAYYLNHVNEVEEYLRRQEAQGDEVQRSVEAEPQYQKRSADIRSRVRRKTQRKNPDR